MAEARRGPDPAVLLAFAAMVLLLGSNFVAVRFSNRELAPFWGGGFRFALGMFLLATIVALRRVPMPRGPAFWGAALFGALAFGGNFAFLYWGLVRTPAGTASVLFATTPLLTFLLAVAVGQERFRLANLAGALVALSGIVLVFRERVGTDVPAGSLLAIFGGALCAATAGIVVKRFPRSHPLSANLVGMSVGAFLLLSLSLVFGEPAALPSRPETIVAVLWLVASSVTAFVLMIWILARWTASATAYGAVLSPIVTILLANALEGEGFPPILLAGGALVLVGVYLGAVRGASTGGPAVSASSPARAR